MEHQLEVLIACLLFTTLLLLLGAFKKSKSSLILPPGPRKLPIIGNLHLLAGCLPYGPHRPFLELAKRYGPIMHFQLGEVSTVVISTKEAAEKVLKTHDIKFADRLYVFAADILLYNCSDIAYAPYGEYWRQMRRIFILELLSAKRIKSFKSIRREEASSMMTTIAASEGSPVTLISLLLATNFTIISRSAFSNLGKKELALIPLIKQIGKELGGFSLGDVFPSLKFLHVITGLKRKLVSLHQKVDRTLDEIIKEHREMKARGETRETDDMVDVLLNLQESGDLELPFTDVNIKALVLEVFMAGIESTSSVVEWAMAELIKNPGEMKRAQAEVREVFGQKGSVDEDGLHKLKYLQLIIKETLRLHVPGPLLIPRQNREKVVIDGYDIPPKTHVIINAWAMTRDPSYWTDPGKFYPDRFLNSSVDYRGTDMQFIPFGAGRRMCPGVSLGEVTVELLLANLLFHFDWKVPNGMKPEDLDMSEGFGATANKLHKLRLVPSSYHPPSFR
ncbi:hypothetical protein K2173_023778 [Erythroxylum novogranatense]|uniref:Cytochrome P450 n=1 Tax=Erythroxylum novogranatense TaxID=1862640 RepID=A0AAV8TJD2_9ROSI|nr:hypothetical protein K2173_023757 [Erythroxylum novogranatense]KAJ8766531.1 hypothetical protein K2173_023778 [Erythroxylum novogranatense]